MSRVFPESGCFQGAYLGSGHARSVEKDPTASLDRPSSRIEMLKRTQHDAPSHPLRLQRLGLVMEPEPGNPQEAEGVLNPAAIRGRDGQLYLFPRLVARGNYSRIGIARVRFNQAGDPTGVERLGTALEPEADYERLPNGGGGCEDPRITFVEPLQRYVMTYTALSPRGPRIALAMSEDLFNWERLGWHASMYRSTCRQGLSPIARN